MSLLTSAAFARMMKSGGSQTIPFGDTQQPKGVRKAFALCEPVTKAQGENTLRFVISTEDIDRSGDKVLVAGWRLENFLKNPVVLWCHDYKSPPCAKGVSIGIEDLKLTSNAQFAVELDPFFKLVYDLYLGGYMRAVSVGFNPLKWQFAEAGSGRMGIDYIESELLEYSCVPVPANPNALIQARSVDHIDTLPMKAWAEEQYDRLSREQKGADVGGVWVPREFLVTLIKTSDDAEPIVGALPDFDITILEADVEPPQEEAPQGDDAPAPEAPAEEPPVEEPPVEEPPADDAAPEGEGEEEGDETGSEAVAEMAMQMPAGSPTFRHHLDDGTVVFMGVVSAMAGLLRGENPHAREFGVGAKNIPAADAYAHLAAHYRDDFDTEPPEQRFVEAQVLRHMNDMFVFDTQSGVLSSVSEGERGIRVLSDWLTQTKTVLNQPATKKALDAHPRKGDIERLMGELNDALQCAERSGTANGTGGIDPEGMMSLEQVAAFLKEEAQPMLREIIDAEVRRLTGRLPE